MFIFLGILLAVGFLAAFVDGGLYWLSKERPKDYRYLVYLARHKYFVFRSGRLTRAPLWRLVIHDWSKLMPGTEWRAYREHFYAKPENKDPFKTAWLRHIHRNPHHWEHWCKFKYENGGAHITLTAYEMPDDLVREMVADWMGAGRAINGVYETCAWYKANKYTMLLHPVTREKVEFLLQDIAASLEGKAC